MHSKGPVVRGLVGLALAGSLCLPATPAHAQWAGPVTTAIEGRALKGTNAPIPQAMLRLRNVASGAILATRLADDAGRFAFTSVEPGVYLVELVNERNKVLAVSQTFTVVRGETVATFVRLSEKNPWFDGLFGNAAMAVATGAATAGVAAVSPDAITPVTPNR